MEKRFRLRNDDDEEQEQVLSFASWDFEKFFTHKTSLPTHSWVGWLVLKSSLKKLVKYSVFPIAHLVALKAYHKLCNFVIWPFEGCYHLSLYFAQKWGYYEKLIKMKHISPWELIRRYMGLDTRHGNLAGSSTKFSFCDVFSSADVLCLHSCEQSVNHCVKTKANYQCNHHKAASNSVMTLLVLVLKRRKWS